MKIAGTEEEIAWAFRALEVAGLCKGCPSREACDASEGIEDAKDTPIEQRPTCGDMLRLAIEAKRRA